TAEPRGEGGLEQISVAGVEQRREPIEPQPIPVLDQRHAYFRLEDPGETAKAPVEPGGNALAPEARILRQHRHGRARQAAARRFARGAGTDGPYAADGVEDGPEQRTKHRRVRLPR